MNPHPRAAIPSAEGFLTQQSTRSYYKLFGASFSEHESQTEPAVLNKVLVHGAKTTLTGELGFVLELAVRSDDLFEGESETVLRLIFAAEDRAARDRWVRELDAAASYTFDKVGYNMVSGPLGLGPYGVCQVCRRDGRLFHGSSIAKNDRTSAILGDEVQHPHIVRVLDLFEDADKYTVVTEPLRRFRMRRPFHESDVRQFFRQVLLGLAALHGHGLVHGNLKPGNLMLAGTRPPYKVKIAGVGFAVTSTAVSVGAVANGKPHYLAPEQVAGKKCGTGSTASSTTSAADCWACGMIMYEMYTGELPFRTKDVLRLYTEGAFEIRYDQHVWNFVSADGLSLIKMLLCKDPDRRVSAFAALHHRWFVRSEAADFGDNYVGLVRNRDGMRAMARLGINPRTRRNMVAFRKCVYAIAFVNALSRPGDDDDDDFLTANSSISRSSEPPVEEGAEQQQQQQQQQQQEEEEEEEVQEEEVEGPPIERRRRGARVGAFLRRLLSCFRPRN